MEKDIMDIVREKEFIALSEEERVELSDICSNEDEFNNLKHVFLNVDVIAASTRVAPKNETKKDLDELFVSTYPKASGVWYSSVLAIITPRDKPIYRQPLVQLAAVGLLVFLMVPFLNNTSVNSQESQVLTAEEKTETIETEFPLSDEFKSDEMILENDENNSEVEEVELDIVSTSSDGAISTDWMFSASASEPMTVTGNGVGIGTSSELLNDHPDGVFAEAEVEISYSIPTSEQPELLDLLTTTF